MQVYILISLPSTIALTPTKKAFLPSFRALSIEGQRRFRVALSLNVRSSLKYILFLLRKSFPFAPFHVRSLAVLEVNLIITGLGFFSLPLFGLGESSNSMSNVHVVCHEVTIFFDNHRFADFHYTSFDTILCLFGQPL